jgi:5-methylthioadenosine/S-adenosylhomocysteine deaminase
LSENAQVSNVRYRLTLIGPAREGSFPSEVLLSRSRFIAPANHSLRFYREYFKPSTERTIEKYRLRWRVLFHGIEFFVNLDHVTQPALGYFLEIKSRTWSRRDAEHKARREIYLSLNLPPETVNTRLCRDRKTTPEQMQAQNIIAVPEKQKKHSKPIMLLPLLVTYCA